MFKGIIAVVVVVIIAAGAWVIFGKNNKASAPTTSSTKSSNSSTASDMSNMNTPAPQQNQTTSTTNSVMIQNFAFSPASVTVKKGTTVTWTNMDSTAHTVTENDSQTGPASGNLANSKTYSFTYSTVGTFKYHCSIHPNMTGTVTVTE